MSRSCSYTNVYRASLVSHTSPFLPLLRLLPFILSSALHLAWLASPTPSSSSILHSALFVPFLLAWGFSFAHQVGRIILAHLTQQRFRSMPWVDWTWAFLVAGALDLHYPLLHQNSNAPPQTQAPYLLTTHTRLALAVSAYLVLTFGTYARFVYLVIDDITDYLGIACFTVRKRGPDGVWRAAVVPGSPGAGTGTGSKSASVGSKGKRDIKGKGKAE